MVPILGGNLCKPLGRIFQKKSLTGSVFPWKDLCVGKVNVSTPGTDLYFNGQFLQNVICIIYTYNCKYCVDTVELLNSITVRTI